MNRKVFNLIMNNSAELLVFFVKNAFIKTNEIREKITKISAVKRCDKTNELSLKKYIRTNTKRRGVISAN